jgi:hypothetical protein
MNKDLNYYLGGIGTLFQEVEDLAADTEDGPGWSVLMDVNRIPEKGLDWLAQFVGITIDHNSDTEYRHQVRAHDRWGRGTPLSMIGPAGRWVPQDGLMYLLERNPDPYGISVIFVEKTVETDQTYAQMFTVYPSYHKVRIAYPTYQAIYTIAVGDWNKVEDAILANKPAAIQVGFIFTDTTIYLAIYILVLQYQNLYTDYVDYQDLYSQPFPDISIIPPVYQQLISTRYYRNIRNQFETYESIMNSYVTY